MKKIYSRIIYIVIILVLPFFAHSQSSEIISGNVKSSGEKQSLPAVSVIVKNSDLGTYTNEKGNFKIKDVKRLPVTLVFSSVGFAGQEVVVTTASQSIQVLLEPSSGLTVDVVVAASRVPERILESPVSIERINLATIRNAPSPSYYDLIGNLKGVDITTSSFAFKTPSTRGFNGSGNLRFNQLVDGMDNQAPALNFSIGSIIGLTELDVESMELLPGASSALYGSGGMNGTLLINSKNPFKYQGLSVQVKQGVNHVNDRQHSAAPYYDYSLRFAKKISEKFAFKIGAQYIKAQDWQANDERNILRNNVVSHIKEGNRQTDPNYDGVNVFGDEASAGMDALAQAAKAQVSRTPGGAAGIAGVDALLATGATPQQIAAFLGSNTATAQLVPYLPFLIPTSAAPGNRYKNTFKGDTPVISRQGYEEKYLVNYNSYNARFSAGLNYKITNDLEASFLGYYGVGTSVYTGADRYSLKNLKMGQYKLELRSKNWFLRGYTTQENSGDSYTATTAALYINNAWKRNEDWFTQYVGVYGAARLGILPGANGMALPEAQAHNVARGVAETGRFLPGTPQFDSAFKKAQTTDISANGARFADKSSLYHYEGQYNFSDKIKFAEVLVGASFRHYSLNSKGTIFADTTGPIGINEYGGYLQVQKLFFKEILKLTGSVRYDKNQNFEGRFTPRLSALIKVAQDNNIRLSYQTAYRFPATQDQYINLLTGGATRLVGGLPQFETFFRFDKNPAYTSQSVVAYRNSLATDPNPALLVPAKFEKVKPETMQSFEIGYKALFSKKLLVDIYGYFSKYENFIGRSAVARGKSDTAELAPRDLASPFSSNNYSFSVNSPTPVKAIGYGIGLEYAFVSNYVATGNFFSDRLTDVPEGLITFFNAPRYRFNIGLNNANVFKGIGFTVNYRWQDKINWEGTFAAGEVPAFGTLDVMVGLRLPKIKSMFKIGASNALNNYYKSSFGNPQVGGLYYASFAYNVL